MDDVLIEVQKGGNAILAVVFRRLGIDGQHGIAMGAQTQVMQETPMEEHGRIDEGTAVEIKDEFAFLRSLSLSKGRRAMDN